MLRIKRSVQATYNTQVNFMASQMLKVYSNATGTGKAWPLRWRSVNSTTDSGSALSLYLLPLPFMLVFWFQCLTWLLGRAAWMT